MLYTLQLLQLDAKDDYLFDFLQLFSYFMGHSIAIYESISKSMFWYKITPSPYNDTFSRAGNFIHINSIILGYLSQNYVHFCGVFFIAWIAYLSVLLLYLIVYKLSRAKLFKFLFKINPFIHHTFVLRLTLLTATAICLGAFLHC